jgi:hypothetical protein
LLSVNELSSGDKDKKKRNSFGFVAIAAASLSSAMLLTTDKLKEKLIDQQKKLDEKFEKKFLETNNFKRPVKITVQSDAGSIASYSSNKKPGGAATTTEGEAVENNISTAAGGVESALNKSKTTLERVSSSVSSSNSNEHKRHSSRLGTANIFTSNEVLILIETWIKNAPNDFMDNQVLDEMKKFFNQLNNLNNSFKIWTSALKEALRLDVNIINNK